MNCPQPRRAPFTLHDQVLNVCQNISGLRPIGVIPRYAAPQMPAPALSTSLSGGSAISWHMKRQCSVSRFHRYSVELAWAGIWGAGVGGGGLQQVSHTLGSVCQ